MGVNCFSCDGSIKLECLERGISSSYIVNYNCRNFVIAKEYLKRLDEGMRNIQLDKRIDRKMLAEYLHDKGDERFLEVLST